MRYPIPLLKERLEASDKLLAKDSEFKDLTLCSGAIEAEIEIDAAITASSIEGNTLSYWLTDRYRTHAGKIDIQEWLSGERLGVPANRAQAVLYRRLVVAKMIRTGYVLEEVPGHGCRIIEIGGRRYFSDGEKCDCGAHVCEHRLVTQEYVYPKSREILTVMKKEESNVI